MPPTIQNLCFNIPFLLIIRHVYSVFSPIFIQTFIFGLQTSTITSGTHSLDIKKADQPQMVIGLDQVITRGDREVVFIERTPK